MRPDGCLRAVLHLDLAQDRLDVDLHRRFGDVELPRDELVRLAPRQTLQDLGLAVRELSRCALLFRFTRLSRRPVQQALTAIAGL